MSKLIPMEEAAKILGLSVEKLNELRSNNEVFGYRDGSTWKFKMSELERVADDMGLSMSSGEGPTLDGIAGALGLGEEEGDSSELDLGLDESSQDLFLEPESDSIALDDSSVELFQSPLGGKDGGTSSDIFSAGDDEDDDDLIDLAESGLLVKNSSKDMLLDKGNDKDDDELSLLESSDDLKLEESGLDLKSEDDGSIKLAGDLVLEGDDDDLSFGSSSLELASEVTASDSPSATGADLFDEEPSSGAPSTGKLAGGDDLSLGDGDDLFDDDLDLADSASFESSEISSDFQESGELVLQDSDSSGELTLEANESGIALSANESGIALGDEPLQLGGSDIDELELPEDDDIILVDDAADADSATLMQEDDFNLTPHEMSLDDDEDSSGSQVIALAESEIYADDSAATVLDGDSFDGQSLDGEFYDPATAGMVGAGVGVGMAASGAGGVAAEEVSYSKGQIASLALTALVLLLGSIVAYGTAQNLWIPDDEVVSSGLMKLFIDGLGMN